MTAACVDPLPLYRPRDPQASDLWRLLDQHFETFQQVYDERFTRPRTDLGHADQAGVRDRPVGLS